jgi:2,5-dihydroxypyridine 5,6-dioxygenase
MGGTPVQKAKLVSLFQAEFERCKVQKGEKAIVLSGERARSGYAEAAVEALQNLGASVFEMRPPAHRSTDGKGKPGVETVGLTPVSGNDIAIETLKLADFVVDLVMLLHSPEQVEILESGTRILMVIEPPEVLERAASTGDFRKIVEAEAEKLKSAQILRITSDAGTDVEMRLGQYPVVTQYGFTDQPGRWDHWPSSFLYTWPNEGGTNGRVVINRGDFVWPLNKYLSDPIILTIEVGYIRKIEGAGDAQLLREKLESFDDPEAYAVSHIGWGVNPNAKWDALLTQPDSVGIEPRSFSGNVQFSTGPNLEAGGNRNTLAHFDMPMLGCTLTLDGKPVVEKGQLVS